ncbi:hypothetical protein CLOM_g15138 [Closterium sp. NIES-68]|nr:hypothetical protein CLOM_g15138 [Closterium sp. NIES-68]GJP58977.1 hypothetical protein CLOP_g6741 [Closterium sp. NIES-67]
MASSVTLRQALSPSPFLTGAPASSLSSTRASVSSGVSLCSLRSTSAQSQSRSVVCSATGTETTATAAASTENWVPVIPMEALPKGERRLIRQDGQEILLFWYRNEIFAVENVSPAEGAYSEGFLNAKFTQDGCIICPSTDTTFDLKTGEIKEWYPKNPILRALTKPLRSLEVFPVKLEDYQVCINMGGRTSGAAEVVVGEASKVGQTATDVNVNETKMVVDESAGGFGFSPQNELLNGRAAMAGFVGLLVIELVTGKGLLNATGFLDFLYSLGLKGPLV